MPNQNPSTRTSEDQTQFTLNKKDVTLATATYSVTANTAAWILTGLKMFKICPGVSNLGTFFLFASGLAAGGATVYNMVT